MKRDIRCVVQVIEHQAHTGRPHHHGVGWARNLPPATSTLFERLQKGNAYQLQPEELQPVIDVAKAAITVSTVEEDILLQFPKLRRSLAKEVARLAILHQQHRCSNLCQSSLFPGQECNKFFPMLPSLFCLVARTPLLDKTGSKRLEDIYAIHVRLQKLLRELSIGPHHSSIAILLSLLKKLGEPPSSVANGGGLTWCGVTFPDGPVMEYVHQQCQEFGESPQDLALLKVYHMSLLTRRHAKYMPKRSVSEVYTAKYNPIILLATKSNIEVDVITHTPHVWFSYITKSADSQTSLKTSQEELVSRGEDDTAAHIAKMVDAQKREVTLGEAFFLLDPHLSLASSNVTVRFVATGYHPIGAELGVLMRPDQAVVVNYASR